MFLGVCSLLVLAYGQLWLPRLELHQDPIQMQIVECRMQSGKTNPPAYSSNSTLCTPHSALRTPHSALKLVAREGSAPPISGCRPDMILFHHRAEQIGNNIGSILAGNAAYLNK